MDNGSTPPIIFLAFANDREDRVDNRYLRNLPEEARRLQSALERAQDQGLCRLVVRQNATVDDILDVFQRADYRNRIALFHYGGHASSYELLFESAEGKPAVADAAGLAAFLGQQTGLEIVFLNGCSTQQQAQGLLEAGVSVVVATSQAIDDAVATDFATRFYQGLAGGATLGVAFKEAEGAVRTTRGGTRDAGTRGGGTRDAYAAAARESLLADRLPWDLYLREGAEAAADWNLPDTAGNPLFGLPPLSNLDLPSGPYRYLDWYRREDAEVFFGRGREIRDLYERVTAPHSAHLVLFYGQSGVGKSSLLAAGLLPRLEGSHVVRYVRRDQTTGLPGTLAAALDAAPDGDLGAAWRAAEERAGRPLLVVLDQVEEVYTRPNVQQPDELACFLAGLEALSAHIGQRPQGRLILSFRKEWLAEIKEGLTEHRLPHGEVFLERLGREGITEVVAGPQATPRLRNQYRLSVAGDLPGLIADDLLADRDSPVSPMLAILLSGMWEAAKARSYDKPAFDADLYHEFRSRGLSLDDFLGRQLQALRGEKPEVVDSGLALDLLAYHTTPLGTAEQRTLADLEQTYQHRLDVLPALIQECRDLYLLVDPSQNQPGQAPATRLTHDTLAPHVHKQFDESDAPGQRAWRILENRAPRSRAANTPQLTLNKVELEAVKQGAAGMPAWSEEQRELVRRSQRRVSLVKWLQWAALILLLFLAAIPIYGQAQDYLWRRAASRPQVEFPTTTVRLGDENPTETRTYPPREVEVPAYAIDKYEVSYEQYRLCMKAEQCSRPRQPAQTEGFDDIDTANGSLPVVWVDAYQAAAFCRWLGMRLPTEAEWERAARGEAFRSYPWADRPPEPAIVNTYLPDYPEAGPLHTVAVDDPAFAGGATPEGIMHLLGNVSEWTASADACEDDPYGCLALWDGQTEVQTVFVRGGSWESDLASPAYYDSVDPLLVLSSIGFRCAQHIP